MRRVLFCGSRDWTDSNLIRELLEAMVHDWGRFTVIHGAASGADTIAGSIAESLGLPVEKYPAQWNSFGKRAGYLRNIEMAATNPDRVVAFQKNESKGTQMMLDIAEKRGIPRTIYYAQITH